MIVALFAILATCVFIWHRRTYSYWKRHNVPHLPPSPIVGHFTPLTKMEKNFAGVLEHIYNNTPDTSADTAVVGVYAFWRTSLLMRDIDLIKQIMIKDFNRFTNRSMNIDPHVDVLGGNNLFIVNNPQWKDLRSQLSPVFTTGKLRQMYPLICEVANLMEEQLKKNLKGEKTIAQPPKLSNGKVEDEVGVLDVKEFCSRFTMDVIASIAFGIKANSLTNTDAEFYYHGQKIFELSILRGLNLACALLFPTLAWLTRVRIFPKPTADFLRTTFSGVMEQRERQFCGLDGKSSSPRNDLIDTLITMKSEIGQTKLKSLDEKNLMDYLLAQAALFKTAGFETSSSALTFALFELAMQPHVQDRLRKEIRETLEKSGSNTPTYEQLNEMPYLKQVVDETLRKYPIVPLLERVFTPLSKEEADAGYSLEPFSNFKVPPEMTLYVSVTGIQRDSKFWPNPDLFDPDRFSPEREHEINWNAYMPFGTGPRNCIGARLGLITTRLGLIHLLRDHRVCVCDRTQREFQFEPRTLPLTAKGGMFLRFERV